MIMIMKIIIIIIIIIITIHSYWRWYLLKHSGSYNAQVNGKCCPHKMIIDKFK